MPAGTQAGDILHLTVEVVATAGSPTFETESVYFKCDDGTIVAGPTSEAGCDVMMNITST